MGKITGIDALNDTKLSDQELYQIDAYWRACNYLAVGMIYLQDNPLLKSPLEVNDLKNDYQAIGDRARVQRLCIPI